MSTGTKHYVFLPHALWGHLRPMLGIVASLLVSNPELHITQFVPLHIYQLVDAEVKRWNLPHPQATSRLKLIRYGAVVEPSEGPEKGMMEVDGTEERHAKWDGPLTPVRETPLQQKAGVSNVRRNYARLLEGKKMLDDVTDPPTEVEPFDIPVDVIVYDYVLETFIPIILEQVENAANPKKRARYLSCSPMAPSFYDLYFHSQAEPNIFGQMYAELDKGAEVKDVWKKLVDDNHSMLKLPGLKPMYAYELTGNAPLDYAIAYFNTKKKVEFKYNRGMIQHCSPFLGQASLDVWHNEQIPMFLVGPILPPTSNDNAISDEGREIQRWLDEKVQAHGEKSVAYVCFGSLFFSPTIDQIPLLVTALAARGKPALMASGNILPEPRRALEAALKEHGNGLIKIVEWIGQQAVLAHPAIGFFVSHCGLGSSLESITAGVPMVFWPDGIDQPLLANRLSLIEGVGIELVQMRTGPSIGRPLARGGRVEGTSAALAAELKDAFSRMDGADNAKMRKECDRMKGEFQRDLAEGGKAWKAMKAIADL